MKRIKKHRIGGMSTKYDYQPELFDKDIKKHREETLKFKGELRALIMLNPGKLDEKYYLAIETLKEIKEEFGL